MALARFVSAFKRGIDGELAALKTSADTFRITLERGEDLGNGRYRFAATTERLTAGTEGTLDTGQRVAIERVGDDHVTLVASQSIALGGPLALVVAPWFLYERLAQALDAIDSPALALALFGHEPHRSEPATLLRDHAALDASQRAAVQLCSESNVAFVWGPPGTGKTATLVHVLDELLARGERILLVSTTNAAIDQVLAKVATQPFFAPGVFVRLGRSEADTFGAEIGDIIDARHGALSKLRARVGEVEQQLRFARALADELAPAVSAQQSLFAAMTQPLRAPALARVFTAPLEHLDARAQLRVIEQRIARLERVRVLTKARVAARDDRGAGIVANARVVLCTLTNAYLSPLMAGERFDTLIAEEAGMATLPALFYAASRASRRAIMVGDPRQLPPIVQSDDPFVRRAIGRNIFELRDRAELVAMLQVQYRMHPAIGGLVGGLFYDGKLSHAAAGTDAIAARPPFPGSAVVVADIQSTCERSQKGMSRVNATSAVVTADLALEAMRGGAEAVAVITPYAAQASEIRRLLAARRIAGVVECSTIHRFQGRECDVVLLDLVDAEPMRPSALVGDAPNLLNVSISRARGKLVIVADVAYFQARAPDGLVAALLTAARDRS